MLQYMERARAHERSEATFRCICCSARRVSVAHSLFPLSPFTVENGETGLSTPSAFEKLSDFIVGSHYFNSNYFL